MNKILEVVIDEFEGEVYVGEYVNVVEYMKEMDEKGNGGMFGSGGNWWVVKSEQDVMMYEGLGEEEIEMINEIVKKDEKIVVGWSDGEGCDGFVVIDESDVKEMRFEEMNSLKERNEMRFLKK